MINKLKERVTKTLRGQLTLWYVATVSTIFVLFSVLVGFLFWRTLNQQVDHHLHIVLSEAQEVVSQYKGTAQQTLIRNLVSAQGMIVVVLSPDGSPILETASPDVSLVAEHELQQILAIANLDNHNPIYFTLDDSRFAAAPVSLATGRGIVAVGYSTNIFKDSVYRLLAVTIGSLALLVLPLTVLGHILLKKQLQPLEKLAQKMGELTDFSALSEKLTISANTEELSTIQHAFNTMTTRLAHVFAIERRFFLDAAHTLKTPLAVLRSQTEAVELKAVQKQEMLKTIDNATETIQNLLLLAKVGSLDYPNESVDLTCILKQLVELASVLGQEKHLQIHSYIQENVTLTANSSLITRALSNVIINAVRYNKESGSVIIKLEMSSTKKIITVTDTGVGIPSSDKEKIFTRFFRASNANIPGAGLGLAITKEVVELFGGNISFNSEKTKGSVFTIEFP